MTSDEELIARVQGALNYWPEKRTFPEALDALDTLARRLEEAQQRAQEQYETLIDAMMMAGMAATDSWRDLPQAISLLHPEPQEEEEQ